MCGRLRLRACECAVISFLLVRVRVIIMISAHIRVCHASVRVCQHKPSSVDENGIKVVKR